MTQCLLNVVHLVDSLVGVLLRGVADETEATATARVTVLDNDLFDFRGMIPLLRR